MRSYTNLLFALLASSVEAIPAAHHVHRRDAAGVSTVVVTATDVVYVTEGENIPFSTSNITPAYVAPTTVEPSSSSTSTSTSYSSSSSASASSSSASSSATYSSGGIDGDLGSFEAPSDNFQDGVYDCSEVPTGNGVISLDWVGLSGWASIMNDNGDVHSTCQEGDLCSYACQPGMSKTQWPSDQPSSGASRGGLRCTNGKLHRTNTGTSHLCEWGAASANAVSSLSNVVSICRTDYPGSENMVIPTRLTGGSTKPISVVVEESYFTWEGKGTSAQYYVNNAGVDVEDGCVWGTSAGTVGNWAPVNIGAGQSGGITYLSIIPNPNNKTPPNYSLKIEADGGSTVIGSCVYADGKYNGQGSDGCTVSVTSGAANFVFY